MDRDEWDENRASELDERIDRVRAAIGDAVRAAGRDSTGLTTVVVTKFHPSAMVRALHERGFADFGESRHQDAEPKVAELAALHATWHFVGQVQSNKARQIAAYSAIIHSFDRRSLISPLVETPVFIQVDLGSAPSGSDRGGVAPDELDALVDDAAAGGIPVLGLMTVAPLGEEPRRAFSALRGLSERVTRVLPTAGGLSMGMSHDFRDAILEGATHLRIGTAITGKRPDRG